MKAALITEEQIKAIEDAMVVTSNQNAHDMLLTGEELRELDKALAIVKSLKVSDPVGIRYNHFGWTVKAFDEELLKTLNRYPDTTPQLLYAGEQP